MKQLSDLSSQQLSNWLSEASQAAKKGKLPNYIPLLQKTEPSVLAISIVAKNNYILTQGDSHIKFPLMSIIKPFLLLYLLSELGDKFIFKKVGYEPSTYPFNSLEQLQLDQGFPRNPMINSGALTLASLLPGKDGDEKCQNLQQWLNKQSEVCLFLDEQMLNSVQSLPNYRNRFLIDELTKKKYIDDPEMTLDTYNKICCLSGNIIDLGRLGLLLVNAPNSLSKNASIVRDIMTTCGLYEASDDWAKQTRFPSKSGVSGAVLSLVPQQGAIACYSPPLDAQGNSVASLYLIEKIAQYLGYLE
ncbi:probable glutaminase [Crocosphaera subtropica ATCC 51142]|uniref:glutaminase n=1 Tax=Crocosphaera subtropica (strain ATCC 51142 / BH68) TaxID=43989 RepID=B1WU51_CROS5|nr:glutaminase [Crocosphaera subtropica]ACB52113.1 probable glutaminase [Crocosphaera subtropica ATCC 51142]